MNWIFCDRLKKSSDNKWAIVWINSINQNFRVSNGCLVTFSLNWISLNATFGTQVKSKRFNAVTNVINDVSVRLNEWLNSIFALSLSLSYSVTSLALNRFIDSEYEEKTQGKRENTWRENNDTGRTPRDNWSCCCCNNGITSSKLMKGKIGSLESDININSSSSRSSALKRIKDPFRCEAFRWMLLLLLLIFLQREQTAMCNKIIKYYLNLLFFLFIFTCVCVCVCRW